MNWCATLQLTGKGIGEVWSWFLHPSQKLKQLPFCFLAFLEMETARFSPEAEHLWCTLPCPLPGIAVLRSQLRTVLTPMPTPRRQANRLTFGLTMPTPTSIALVMERKLTVRWCYQ
jgi:hypothetical protein